MNYKKNNSSLSIIEWLVETFLAFTIPGILCVTLLIFSFPVIYDIQTIFYDLGLPGKIAFSIFWPTVIGMTLCSIGSFFIDGLLKLFRLDKRIDSLVAHTQSTQTSIRQFTHDVLKYVTPNKNYLSQRGGTIKDTVREQLAPSSTMHLFNQGIMGMIVLISIAVLGKTIAMHTFDNLKYIIPAVVIITFIWINIVLGFYTDYLTKVYHISINNAIKYAKSTQSNQTRRNTPYRPQQRHRSNTQSQRPNQQNQRPNQQSQNRHTEHKQDQ